ncbi:hypothetical protein GCM10027451_33820 [Geodermatophilus aquaeductus]
MPETPGKDPVPLTPRRLGASLRTGPTSDVHPVAHTAGVQPRPATVQGPAASVRAVGDTVVLTDGGGARPGPCTRGTVGAATDVDESRNPGRSVLSDPCGPVRALDSGGRGWGT